MSYPMLDRQSYQSMSSDWVLYAGQLLQQLGYLSNEPTGAYDEELATAVAAFQTASGIDERDHVGPGTWAALAGWYEAGYQTEAGTTAEEAPASDAEVDALELQPKAKAIALKLKTKYPSISFTSGKRDEVTEQAWAMAGNVVADRQWITETYADQTLAKELQDWLDENEAATTQADISAGLESVMNGWDDAKKGRLSAHFSGEAFDIQPQTDQATEITADARAWAEAEGGKFLEQEGGLVRWHVQVRE